jgi:hypothetical protein
VLRNSKVEKEAEQALQIHPAPRIGGKLGIQFQLLTATIRPNFPEYQPL